MKCARCGAPDEGVSILCAYCGTALRPIQSVADEMKALQELPQAASRLAAELAGFAMNAMEIDGKLGAFWSNAFVPTTVTGKKRAASDAITLAEQSRSDGIEGGARGSLLGRARALIEDLRLEAAMGSTEVSTSDVRLLEQRLGTKAAWYRTPTAQALMFTAGVCLALAVGVNSIVSGHVVDKCRGTWNRPGIEHCDDDCREWACRDLCQDGETWACGVLREINPDATDYEAAGRAPDESDEPTPPSAPVPMERRLAPASLVGTYEQAQRYGEPIVLTVSPTGLHVSTYGGSTIAWEEISSPSTGVWVFRTPQAHRRGTDDERYGDVVGGSLTMTDPLTVVVSVDTDDQDWFSGTYRRR